LNKNNFQSHRKKIFEAKYKKFPCESILERNNSRLCNDHREANATYVQKNKDFTEFLFMYAEENLAVLYLFIKDPYYTKIKKDESVRKANHNSVKIVKYNVVHSTLASDTD